MRKKSRWTKNSFITLKHHSAHRTTCEKTQNTTFFYDTEAAVAVQQQVWSVSGYNVCGAVRRTETRGSTVQSSRQTAVVELRAIALKLLGSFNCGSCGKRSCFHIVSHSDIFWFFCSYSYAGLNILEALKCHSSGNIYIRKHFFNVKSYLLLFLVIMSSYLTNATLQLTNASLSANSDFISHTTFIILSSVTGHSCKIVAITKNSHNYKNKK